jgi:hypothetical protein
MLKRPIQRENETMTRIEGPLNYAVKDKNDITLAYFLFGVDALRFIASYGGNDEFTVNGITFTPKDVATQDQRLDAWERIRTG